MFSNVEQILKILETYCLFKWYKTCFSSSDFQLLSFISLELNFFFIIWTYFQNFGIFLYECYEKRIITYDTLSDLQVITYNHHQITLLISSQFSLLPVSPVIFNDFILVYKEIVKASYDGLNYFSSFAIKWLFGIYMRLTYPSLFELGLMLSLIRTTFT